MAYYVNVAEWTSDQVVDWLKGLDNAMYLYLDSFSNNHIGGDKLLNVRPYILEELGVSVIGHQEIILEAVEHLRNFHFDLNKENLQHLALQLATAARNLYKQLERNLDKKMIETEALKDIMRTIGKIKPLICWLDRPPFKGQLQYIEIRKQMLRLALEMAISAQRDRFAFKLVEQIFSNAEKLAKLCDYIIQDISDPMLLQPANLILVTLKKKESDLGFYVSPSFNGIYKVTEIKFNSPAHISGKIEEGDEVIQVNYQTVVGWQHKRVLLQLQESKPDVLLTLKKRPKHTKIYGQIYMKPYRLPSKKRPMQYRWGETNSPRAELFSFHDFPLPSLAKGRDLETPAVLRQQQPISSSDEVASSKKNTVVGHPEEDSDSDLLTPTEPKPLRNELEILLQTSRPFLQRRNTIGGDQTASLKFIVGNVKFWQDHKDKSISMGYGLEKSVAAIPFLSQLNGSMPDILAKKGDNTADDQQQKTQQITNEEQQQPCDNEVSMRLERTPSVIREGVSKVVRFDANSVPPDDETINNKYTFSIDNTIRETLEPIPYVDEDAPDWNRSSEPPPVTERSPPVAERSPPTVNCEMEPKLAEAINHRLIQQKPFLLEAKLKLPDPDSDVPPAVEPRMEHLQKAPPTPPPRPKKPPELSPSTTSVHQSPKVSCDSPKEPTPNKLPITPKLSDSQLSGSLCEENGALELVTQIMKQKSLPSRKKNSILAKRRRIGVKELQHSDIQGHLYRRTKDKTGTSYWAKGYFVLVENALYFFRTKDATKADFRIILSGFTVSLASEIHSRPFAFKVYHALKSLYFAAETQEALSQWMDYLRQATMKGVNFASSSKDITDIKQIFTETESSGEDCDGGNNAEEPVVVPVAKHEKYHLGLGSLKKFTKASLLNKSTGSGSSEKKSDLPIPSAQFRSYKKVQGFAGLSAGNHFFPPDLPVHHDHVQAPASSCIVEKVPPSPSTKPIPSPIVIPSQKVVLLPLKESLPPEPSSPPPPSVTSSPVAKQRSPAKKPQPFNYIHASNPNLVDFECHQIASRGVLEFSPLVGGNKGQSAWGGDGMGGNAPAGSHSLQGFITLKDLMLQQQAEDAKEVYNNRVFLGREKKDDQKARAGGKGRTDSQRSVVASATANTENNHLKINYGGNHQKIDKIQSRSLPKTPDYAQSFKPDDVDIIMIRSKEGQTLRNFGYEFISEEEPAEANLLRNQQQVPRQRTRRTDKVSPTTSWSKRKGLNWINTNVALNGGAERGAENEVKARKRSDIKLPTEKIFLFNKSAMLAMHTSGTGSGDTGGTRKSPSSPSHLVMAAAVAGAPPLTPQSLASVSKKSHFFGLDSKKSSSLNGSGGDFKENAIGYQQQQQQPRKMSVPERSASYFTKLSFSSSGAKTGTTTPAASTVAAAVKEKKIFGSPRLHRAIFGKHQTNNPGNRSPLFDEMSMSTANSGSVASDSRRESLNLTDTVIVASSSPLIKLATSSGVGGTPTDYPNLECPPVFEPETYSLSDPSTSNSIRRRNKKV